MLRPPLLDQAEAWLALRPRAAPEPTGETRAFIAASRAADDTDKAAKEEQIRRLRRATGMGFIAAVRQAVAAGYHDKAIRHAVAGAILADDPDFELVPELYRSLGTAVSAPRAEAVFSLECR